MTSANCSRDSTSSNADSQAVAALVVATSGAGAFRIAVPSDDPQSLAGHALLHPLRHQANRLNRRSILSTAHQAARIHSPLRPPGNPKPHHLLLPLVSKAQWARRDPRLLRMTPRAEERKPRLRVAGRHPTQAPLQAIRMRPLTECRPSRHDLMSLKVLPHLPFARARPRTDVVHPRKQDARRQTGKVRHQ